MAATATAERPSPAATQRPSDVDVLVVGAGFSGLYLLHKLRGLGLSTRVLEAADDVGGTWYWNRYPGARCDIVTTDYSFSFDPELEKAWTWSEKYATQPEILRYAQFVAERYDLRRDIDFNTRVAHARWDEPSGRWQVHTSRGESLSARYCIMATGCLSMPKEPDIPGAGQFKGEVYATSRWPHTPVDFSGKRVAVIGTGSSGIQSIPLIAQQAKALTVLQRTPNFSIPAGNGPAPADRVAALQADRSAYRQAAKWSRAGVPGTPTDVMGRFSPPGLQRERLEAAWATGELIPMLSVFADQALFPEANAIVAEFVREKIRAVVKDPQTAERLCPKDHPFGTKRPCLDTGYYATFNLPHVRLVDLRQTPIATINTSGIALQDGEQLEVDAIVYATGFDAMTGAIVAVDITGRDGQTLKQKWAEGPLNYLGLMARGFPNLFMVTGPGSPSVLSNMMVSIEQHVDWVTDCLSHLRAQGLNRIEPTATAEAGWVQHQADCANITLFPQANSWYMGANVPGKPRLLMPYVGGVDAYRQACDEVVAQGYLGFELGGPGGKRQCQDGVVRRLQPDVAMVLQMVAALNLPKFETLPATGARELLAMVNSQRPPGPALAEVRDGQLPGADGQPLAWRLYRPRTDVALPLVVYFHGGGWVLGSHDSDDPLCRDMAQRAGVAIVSVNYRHAPEARFPAATDDALAAVRWVAAHAAELGAEEGAGQQLAVAGWSAGGNLAAVTCQRVRDEGGPRLAGQLLLTPVTDSDFSRPSYTENADGYVLTTPLMHWFWNHYADPDQRQDPKLAPLRAPRLAGLPPAVVVTCQFDPLRDEGVAYAEALAQAGVPVQQIRGRGHTHTSLGMVDIIVSGAPVRAQMAQALRSFFH